MLIHSKKRKLQLGGSLNQAKNEYAPIDIRWKQFDLSASKPTELNIPNGSGRGMGSGRGAGDGKDYPGLPSDVAYVDSQLQQARSRISDGLAGPNSAEYKDSSTFNQDSADVSKWAGIRSTMLKARQDNFNTTKTRLSKATDDYAMFGGTALAKDTTTGEYAMVDTSTLMTERVKNGDNISARYIPATAGEALNMRFDSPEFSGFTDKGAQLDSILNNVLDSDTITDDMNKLFKSVGQVNEAQTSFITQDGQSLSISDLVQNLTEAGENYTKVNMKSASNRKNLETAVGLFRSNMSNNQLDTLRNKAVADFVKEYGSKNVNPQAANEWVDSRVNAQIAQRAAAFLKISSGKSAGVSGSSGSSDGLDKRTFDTNRITLKRLSPDGTPVEIETDYEDVPGIKDKFDLMASINSSTINISDAVDADIKEELVTTGQSKFLRTLTEGDLGKNFFLGDADSTPIKSLNGGTGLDNTMIRSEGGTQMKILEGMPYYEDSNGTKRIAWEKISDAVTWGRTYKKISDDMLSKTGVAHLGPEEKLEVIRQTIQQTGIDMSAASGIKMGDIAMIPILFNDQRGFDDNLQNVFSSKVSGKEDRSFKAIRNRWKAEDTKNTLAFVVLPDNFESTLPDHYGPIFKIPKPISLKQVVDSAKSSQNNRFDWLELISSHATMDVTEQN